MHSEQMGLFQLENFFSELQPYYQTRTKSIYGTEVKLKKKENKTPE